MNVLQLMDGMPTAFIVDWGTQSKPLPFYHSQKNLSFQISLSVLLLPRRTRFSEIICSKYLSNHDVITCLSEITIYDYLLLRLMCQYSSSQLYLCERSSCPWLWYELIFPLPCFTTDCTSLSQSSNTSSQVCRRTGVSPIFQYECWLQ